jgi:DNA helicase-2/ATP-dependent DNA helicase PcrA
MMDEDTGGYHLDALNDAQREAAKHIEGPLLVFAGPGTGKTRMVVHKIAHLIGDRGYEADQVLALTFSESAAREMQDRVERLLPGRTRVMVSTFHSFCNELIRDHSLDIGINMTAGVITDEHQKTFLLENLDRAGLEFLKVPVRPIELARDIHSTITRLKQENVPLDRLERYLDGAGEDGGEGTAHLRDVARAYRLYEEFKEDRSLVDFGDMQHLALRLLDERPSVLADLRRRYRYIIVDEFQDTDFTQLRILLALAGEGNVTVVGDDDQSIYRFRGAYLTNVHDFLEHYRDRGIGVTEVVLTRNYRCTGNIQAVATSLIGNNPERQPKEIETHKGGGQPVHITKYATDGDQARGMVRSIQRLHGDGVALDDIAILVRSRFHARPITEALERARVPFEIIGSRDYFRHREVRAALAYLRVLSDPNSNAPDLGHIMLRPVHGIPPGDIPRLARFAKDKGVTMWEALGDLEGFEGDETRLTIFRQGLDDLFRVAGEGDLWNTVRAVLFGRDLFRVEISEADTDGVRHLNRLLHLTAEFSDIYTDASLGALIRYLEALRDLGLTDEETEPVGGLVHLLTIHGAKGREFPYVFIPCLSENRVPTRHRPPKIPIPQDLWDGIPSQFGDREVHLHEERRLLYVGITRGKDGVFLSLAERYGTNKGTTNPSTFLPEILEGPGHEMLEEVLEVAEEPEDRANTVEELLHDRLVGDVASGDYQEALEALVALARLKEDGNGDLVMPADIDLEGYVSMVRARYDEPETMHAATATFSPSKLRTYEDCPAMYRFGYVLGIPQKKKTFFELGTLVHAVIERLSKRIIDGHDVTEDEALALLDAAWKASVWDLEELERQDRQAAEEMIRDFLVHQAARSSDIAGVEQWIDLELEGRRVSGKIDRVDDLGDGLEVIDYKTSKKPESRPKLKQDFQMVLYWEGAECAYQQPVKRVGHWYLRHDKEVMVEISPDEREEVLERARGIIRAVEAGSFGATPGYRTCMYCDYADLCDDRYQ